MHAPLPLTRGTEPDLGTGSDEENGSGAAPVAGEPDAYAAARIGALLQMAGKLTADNADRVARAQHELGLRFGEAAIRLGLINQDDIDAAIARQFAYPVAVRGGSTLSPRLVAAFHPACSQGDTLRAIRSQLLLRWFGTGQYALAVGGAGQGDASSVLAANLALVFAQLGHRTLLVDANLRHGIQQGLFGLTARNSKTDGENLSAGKSHAVATASTSSGTSSPVPESARVGRIQPDMLLPGHFPSGPGFPSAAQPGLSDLLAGRAGLDAIVEVPGFSALSVLVSGTVPPNPHELLERANFAALHAELGKRYDVVLYDVAPTSHGAEALAVAAHAGAALLVALKDVTPLQALKRMAQQMDAARIAVIGSVLVEA